MGCCYGNTKTFEQWETAQLNLEDEIIQLSDSRLTNMKDNLQLFKWMEHHLKYEHFILIEMTKVKKHLF